MDSIKAKLTAKVGPLPVWAWAAIGLAVVLGYMWYTKSGFFGSGTAGAADNSGSASSGNDLSDMLGAGGAGGAALPGSSTTVTQPGIAFTTGNNSTAPATTAGSLASDPPALAAANRGGTYSSFLPGANFEPAYAATVNPPSQLTLLRGNLVSIPAAIGQRVSTTFNPVRARSSGTKAIG